MLRFSNVVFEPPTITIEFSPFSFNIIKAYPVSTPSNYFIYFKSKPEEAISLLKTIYYKYYYHIISYH